jgi:hypothetical protein
MYRYVLFILGFLVGTLLALSIINSAAGLIDRRSPDVVIIEQLDQCPRCGYTESMGVPGVAL